MESIKGIGSILKEAMENIDKKQKKTGPNYIEFKSDIKKLFNDQTMFAETNKERLADKSWAN